MSLDGSDAATHEWMRGVEGCFDAAIRGIKNLVDAGLRPQVIMSLLRRNKDQMEGVVRLAESLGAGSVKFNMVQPTARGERLHEAGETLSLEELVQLGQWVETDLSVLNKSQAVLQPSHSLSAFEQDVRRHWGMGADSAAYSGYSGFSVMVRMRFAASVRPCPNLYSATLTAIGWKMFGTATLFSGN